MRYMMLIVNGEAPPADVDMGEVFGQFMRLTDELKAQGKFIDSARLRPLSEAKTVRLRKGAKPVVVDGPFTETKEGVGGYFLIECASQQEALEWAKKFPPYFQIEVNAVWPPESYR